MLPDWGSSGWYSFGWPKRPQVAHFSVAVNTRLVPASAGGAWRRCRVPHRTDRLLARLQKSTLSWRFDGRVSPSAGHQLRGRLDVTPAGLPPASRSQLRRTHTTGTPAFDSNTAGRPSPELRTRSRRNRGS